MAIVDLNSLSIVELQRIQHELPKVLETKRIQEQDAALLKVKALAEELGYSLSELTRRTERVKSKKPTSPTIAKYKNPKDSTQTYSGKGRKPNWLIELLEAGANIEDFAI